MDITRLVDTCSGDTTAYIAIGHHDPIEFCANLLKEFDEEIDPKHVRHVLGRNTPLNKYQSEFCTYQFDVVTKKGRGVYPVTMIDL